MARIAIFLPTLQIGGAERVAVRLANDFAQRHHEVDILLRRREGELLSQVSRDVRVVGFERSRLIAVLPPLVYYLRTHRPAAILSLLSNPNVIASLAVMLSGTRTRLVLSEHNTLSSARAQKRDLLSRLVKPLYRRSDAIVAVSEGVARDLVDELQLATEAVHVVHNPIVDDTLYELAQEPVDDHWMGDDSVPVVLAAGRLVRQKDFETLINAFRIVRNSLAARLIILGEGEGKQGLLEQVSARGLSDCVRLLEFVGNPYSWMARSRLFVLSSRWEGFGNVLVEAMACGVPVVSTDCPNGPAEILENGRWGRLVPVGNPQLLAQAIAEALVEDRAHVNVRERARQFSVARAAERYLALLLDGTAQSGSGRPVR